MGSAVSISRDFGSNVELECSTTTTSPIAIGAEQAFTYFFYVCAGALFVNNAMRNKLCVFKAMSAFKFTLMVIRGLSKGVNGVKIGVKSFHLSIRQNLGGGYQIKILVFYRRNLSSRISVI